MESSPFWYFIYLHWPFFGFSMIVYLLVFYLTNWKTFINP